MGSASSARLASEASLPEARSGLRRKDDTAIAGPAAVRASRVVAAKLIADPVAWSKAKEDFKLAMLQPSSKSTLDTRLESCEKFVADALKVPLLPLTEEKLFNLGAALRGAHYLAGPEYLRVAKAEHLASNMPWTGSMDRMFNRCVKASRRGRGPITRAGLGDMEAFSSAAVVDQGLAERGPLAASTYALTCVAFLLREIEGSLIAMRQVRPFVDADGKGIRLDLPSSKVDFWGAGVSRSVSCTCTAGNRLGMSCVACRVTEQFLHRERQGAGPEAPLFPDSSDRFPSKQGATQALQRLWIPLEGVIAGHSPRRMGAQLLVALGGP